MTLHPSPREEFLEDGRAGVLHIGNSNHSLLYTVRKLKLSKFRPNVNKVWDFKTFFRFSISFRSFSGTLGCDWEIYFSRNPKQYAPLQLRRTKANPVPWITPTIKQLMREMDYHKKAKKSNSTIHWEK